jgi:hydrogenase maturation protease
VRILVAGVGNVFLSDDGFGSEVARRLLGASDLPAVVEVVDVGIRGMHLAYQVLDGYGVLLVVDTAQSGGLPGSLSFFEHDLAAASGDAAFDPHGMEPDAVLELVGALARGVGGHELDRVLVLACEPADLGEGMGLTPAVAAAVDEAVGAVHRIVGRLLDGRPFTETTATTTTATGASA